jgi:hypothetical protein
LILESLLKKIAVLAVRKDGKACWGVSAPVAGRLQHPEARFCTTCSTQAHDCKGCGS